MALKISISGVRGLVPDYLTPEICLDFSKAFGTFLDAGPKNKTVVIGTDPRASSEYIKGIVFSGLLFTGCRVIDLGICPTPTVGIMVRKLKAAGGIIITASHNPLPWNGIKFVRNDGIFLNQKQLRRLVRIFEEKTFVKSGPGTVSANSSAIAIHLKKTLGAINVPRIQKKRYKVVLDCGNGAGSVICVELLKRLGCRLKAINCDITRPFPRSPEPVAKNLGALSALIKKEKTDIGFALDSDADRLAIIGGDGKPIGEETTLVLAVKSILSKQSARSRAKKIVITNLSTTSAIDDIAKMFGGSVIRTRIGEVHIAEKMKELDGLIGGEGNGGVIYPPIGFNRDGLAAIALVLDYMAASGKSLKELIAGLPAYAMLKEKIECKDQAAADGLINKTRTLFKKGRLILKDGVKVLFPQSWVHVRASNTEPVIRIIAEGKKRSEAKRLIQQVLHS